MRRAWALLVFGAGVVGATIWAVHFGYLDNPSTIYETFLAYFRGAANKVKSIGSNVTEAIGGTPPDPMEKALEIISEFEGFSAKAYPDADGYSIGYGHFIRAADPYNSSSVISEADAWELLKQDAAGAFGCVNSNVEVELTPNQTAALISFCYNVGCGNFRSSTLLRLLNQGDYAGAAAQFPAWNKSRGSVVDALVSRRSDEQNLFNS